MSDQASLAVRWITSSECPPIWQERRPEPNAEFEHVHLVCRLRPEVREPYSLLVGAREDRGTPVLVVGRLERQRVWGRFGYWRVGGLPVRAWVGVRGGWLGEPAPSQVAAVLQEVAALLQSGKVDLAVFSGLPQTAPIWGILQELRPRLPLTYLSPWTPHYFLRLEEDPQFLWKRMRSKHRSWLRNRERRLRERSSEGIRYEWYSRFSPESLQQLFARLEPVAASSYHRALGVGFRDDLEHRERFQLFARQGILRVQTLESDGRLLSFWIGWLSGGTFYSSETAYHPDAAEYEPGKLVFLKMVENLVEEGAHTFDFGPGDADYKRRFSDHQCAERDLYLFRRSPRGFGAALLVAGLGRAHEAAKRWTDRLGWVNRIRTGWRRRLQKWR